jgi:hypothetical protein
LKTTVATTCYLVENGALEFGQTGMCAAGQADDCQRSRDLALVCQDPVPIQLNSKVTACRARNGGRFCRSETANNRFKTLTGDSNGLS